jgi:hypothetical protein
MSPKNVISNQPRMARMGTDLGDAPWFCSSRLFAILALKDSDSLT